MILTSLFFILLASFFNDFDGKFAAPRLSVDNSYVKNHSIVSKYPLAYNFDKVLDPYKNYLISW